MENTALIAIEKPLGATERAGLVARARVLAWIGIGWHFAEAGIALVAGIAAGSVALVGFGADSLIESLAGFIVVWRFTDQRRESDAAELKAQRLIALCFYALALYISIEALRAFVEGEIPAVSWIGIGLAVVTLVTMPLLASAKARVGERLHSSATVSEGRQNMVCAYLSAALLVGLLANAALNWWWADLVTALLIAGVALYEGRGSWRGDACCDTC